LSPEWPLKVRVGANSPSLCPTIFSVTNTGTNKRPLWAAIVKPTMSGTITERLDQVLIGFLLPEEIAVSTFFSKCVSMNGPFLTERDTLYPHYYFLSRRRRTINLSVRLLLRVL